MEEKGQLQGPSQREKKQDMMPLCILTYVGAGGKVEDMQALDVSSLGSLGPAPFLFLSTAQASLPASSPSR